MTEALARRDTPSLARKLALIAQSCSYVQKTGRNDFHKYRYATAADVLAKVNDALAEHGVCATVNPEMLSESVDNGNRTVTVKVNLTLHDGDSEQSFTTAGIGCGQDKGDKAVMKAQTAAIKYAWLLALNISTGDDPEADDETDKRNHAPPPRPQHAPTTPARPRLEMDDSAPATPPRPVHDDGLRTVGPPVPSVQEMDAEQTPDPALTRRLQTVTKRPELAPLTAGQKVSKPDKPMGPAERNAWALYDRAFALGAPPPSGSAEDHENYAKEWRTRLQGQAAGVAR